MFFNHIVEALTKRLHAAWPKHDVSSNDDVEIMAIDIVKLFVVFPIKFHTFYTILTRLFDLSSIYVEQFNNYVISICQDNLFSISTADDT